MRTYFQKIIPSYTVLITLLVAVGASFAGGVYAGQEKVVAIPQSPQQPAGVDFNPVWKAWDIINQKYVPVIVASSTPHATTTATANKERVYGLIAGLAESLDDPYSMFLPPQENKNFSQTMSGAFEGVGMEIAVKKDILTVVSPIKGTPSEKAGIKAKDEILKIDGTDTKGMDADKAVSLIRGPKGTVVTLNIYRDGWDAPRDIKVTRDTINVPIVTTDNTHDGVFVIAITTFTANAPDEFRKALQEFATSGKSRLVLDVRGNPGGYLEAAVSIASWFLPEGTKIVTEDYDGHATNVVHTSYGYSGVDPNLKMVMLVNGGSASASEILAGALSQNGKAKLIGTKTFGKGSVQELIPITSDTNLKLTVARWITPSGNPIPTDGIRPDIEIDRTDKDITDGKDPQLDKAIEVVKGL